LAKIRGDWSRIFGKKINSPHVLMTVMRTGKKGKKTAFREGLRKLRSGNYVMSISEKSRRAPGAALDTRTERRRRSLLLNERRSD